MIPAFVIRLKGIKTSEDLALECIKSCDALGLEVTPFDGIFGEQLISFAHLQQGLRPWKQKMKKGRTGVKGCFLSHFSLWRRSVQLDTPIIIFEQDAVLLRPIPKDIEHHFKEFLMLDPYNKMRGDYGENHTKDDSKEWRVEEYFNPDSSSKYGVTHQYTMGLQAYIIKPKAAKKLIRAVKENGYLPADIQCNKGIINIETIYPSVAAINTKFWGNKGLMKQESTTHKKW